MDYDGSGRLVEETAGTGKPNVDAKMSITGICAGMRF